MEGLLNPGSGTSRRARGRTTVSLPETTAAATVRAHACSDVIDLTRYPIHDLKGAEGRALIRRCREDLADHGACVLPGFISHDAVRAMIDCAGELHSTA